MSQLRTYETATEADFVIVCIAERCAKKFVVKETRSVPPRAARPWLQILLARE
jgi:hypothetical protein